MTENNQEVTADGPTPIFQKAVGFVVETRRLGNRRKVNTAQIGTDADHDSCEQEHSRQQGAKKG